MKQILITFISGLIGLSMLIECSSIPKRLYTPEQAARIIADGQRTPLVKQLEKFKMAIKQGNYYSALDMLPDWERKTLMGHRLEINERVKNRLKAFRIKKVLGQSDVRLHNGKITGLVNHLPAAGDNDSKDYITSGPKDGQNGS